MRITRGQLPQYADEIYLFNKALERTNNSAVLKCWVKSRVLLTMLHAQAINLVHSNFEPLIELTMQRSIGRKSETTDLHVDDPISYGESQNLEEEMELVNILH